MKSRFSSSLFAVRTVWLTLPDKPGQDFSEVFPDEVTLDRFESLLRRARRLRVVRNLFFLVVGFFCARLVFLQVFHGQEYLAMAEANKTHAIVTPAHRGGIFDRNGIVLAKNVPVFRLLLLARDLPSEKEEPEARAADFALVKSLFQVSDEDLSRVLNDPASQTTQLLVRSHVSYDAAMAFYARSSQMPGFSVELAEERSYLTDGIGSLSHVLGFTGVLTQEEYTEHKNEGYRPFDSIGKQGLEAQYENLLRGRLGKDVYEVNAKGKILRLVSHESPESGQDIRLTVDARLQAYIEETLQKRLAFAPTQRAAVVVSNPQNGDVLALVSYPGFDANAFVGGISSEAYKAYINDPNAPLFPRATAGEYPSGSSIKPVFAAAALSLGVITPQTTFLSTGGLMLGGRLFPDWRPGGHGLTNVYHAIADSVNTFFYMIGGGTDTFHGMGVTQLMDWARKFGFGELTGIDLPHEANGFLPSPQWKKTTKGEDWYLGDTYNVSIGQGDVLVTPLQINRATAALAAGGLLRTPHLLLSDRVSDLGSRIVSEDVANVVRDAMRDTVTQGTARALQDLPVPAAGKTGTAQWSNGYHPHSWFTGFAPFAHPSVAITVLVEQGGDLNIATPIANDILLWYFNNISE